MKLTNRDCEFLTDLSNVKYLNSNRIARLFGNYKSAMRRMKILKDNGYIQSLNQSEYVYSIKGFSKKTDKIAHFLACADFYFYIKSNHKIENFLLEKQIKFRYGGKSHSFRPDIISLIDNRWYMIEVDLMNRRFEEKIKRWEMYYLSNEFTKMFDKFPPIMIVSTNIDRVQNIILKNKTIDFNYFFKSYQEVSDWKYVYMYRKK